MHGLYKAMFALFTYVISLYIVFIFLFPKHHCSEHVARQNEKQQKNKAAPMDYVGFYVAWYRFLQLRYVTTNFFIVLHILLVKIS